MSQVASATKHDFTDRTKYDVLMEIIRNRITTRAFDPNCVVPREHYDMILEAARHAPSGANAQPWHFIVITDQNLKNKIMEYFREEQTVRAKLKMKFPTPDYRGLATAPGFIQRRVGPRQDVQGKRRAHFAAKRGGGNDVGASRRSRAWLQCVVGDCDRTGESAEGDEAAARHSR